MTAAIEVRGLRKTYRPAFGGRAIDALAGHRFRGSAGRALRPPGPERRGEDHDRQDPPRPHARDGRRGFAPRAARAIPRAGGASATCRKGTGSPAISRRGRRCRLRPHVGRRPRDAEGADPGLLERVKLGGLDRREGEEVLQGHDAAPRPRVRARSRAGGAAPRRADGRRRSGRAARDPRPAPGRGREGARDPPQLPPPLRDRAHVRPRGRAAQGAHRRDRDGGGIDEARREKILRRATSWRPRLFPRS